MRDIKFRAWYSKSQSWIYFDLQKGFATDFALSVYRDLVIEGTTFYQFTGLKDKNGKEIYEGDIVHRYLGVYWAVSYTENGWRGLPYHDTGLYMDAKQLSEECEVIGHIYENPDLLK